MFNHIEMRRRMVQERIEKSFDNEIEKAKHQVGDVHPNGKWIWTEYAPGKFDWKSKKGKYYKNGGSNVAVPSKTPEDKGYAERFKKNFKDASDDVLNKVISGKIQGTDADKRLAKEILDERKSSAEGEKYAAKIIDLLTTSDSKYTDIKKVTALKTNKGNWAIDYDGANTGIILNGSKLSEKGLKAAGVKIEGGSSKGDEMKLSDFKGERRGIVTKALDRAKKEKRVMIVGHDYDNQMFVDDAVDYSPSIELRGVFATVYPDGRIERGFVEQTEETDQKEDPKQDKVAQDAGAITLKITTDGSGVVKLSDSVNAKWQDVKDADFGGRIIGIKIDGKPGAKAFPYSFDSAKRKKYGLYTFEEAKAEAEKYLNNKKSELTKKTAAGDKSDDKKKLYAIKNKIASSE